MIKVITIYSDGACSGNPGPGGWGAVLEYNGKVKEICGGQLDTTNNQMELMAACEALECVHTDNVPIQMYLDSAYVLTGITQWIHGWKSKGWVTGNKKTPVKNKELWLRLDKAKSRQSIIEFIKVKGHSGVELNELADQLANKGLNQIRGGN